MPVAGSATRSLENEMSEKIVSREETKFEIVAQRNVGGYLGEEGHPWCESATLVVEKTTEEGFGYFRSYVEYGYDVKYELISIDRGLSGTGVVLHLKLGMDSVLRLYTATPVSDPDGGGSLVTPEYLRESAWQHKSPQRR
jgi:hypothetical protein